MVSRVWRLLFLAALLPGLALAGRSNVAVVDVSQAAPSSFGRQGYPYPAFAVLDEELHEFSDEPYVWTLGATLRGQEAGGDWVGTGVIEVWPSLSAYTEAPTEPPCIITQKLEADKLPAASGLSCPGCSVYHQVEAVAYSASGSCEPGAVTRLAASYRWKYQGYRDAASAGWPADLEDTAGLKAAGYKGVVYSTDLTVDEGGGFSRYYLVHLD